MPTIIIFINTAFSFFMWLTVRVTPGKRGSEAKGMNHLFSSCAVLLLTGSFPRKTWLSSLPAKVLLCSKTHIPFKIDSTYFAFISGYFLIERLENQNFTCIEICVVSSALFNSCLCTLLSLQVKQRIPTGLAMPPSASSLWLLPRLLQLQALSVACGTGPVSPGGGAIESQVASLSVCVESSHGWLHHQDVWHQRPGQQTSVRGDLGTGTSRRPWPLESFDNIDNGECEMTQ